MSRRRVLENDETKRRGDEVRDVETEGTKERGNKGSGE